ncbi:MAG: tRNA (adenosine(37)-N6)-dimethylallyltransferase MiaA [Polyangiaceae bacterium]
MTSSSDASAAERFLASARRDDGALIAVVGPTATGKTALAVALAERLGGEIVGADSVQIYRHFDIGSGKPSAAEMSRAPHHLVGAIDPLAPIDAAAWAERAAAELDAVRARGKVPILCGGTFLWVKALLFGLAEAPPGNAALRSRHAEVARSEGRAALHGRLAAVDPDCAQRLHPNDFVRVSRALEVHELTGRPMSVWQREHGFREERTRARLVARAVEPASLTESITARARGWLGSGWIEEVESLVERGYGEARAMGSVGYAQVHAMLGGELPRADLQTAVVRATRVFARRQRTWLNHADVTWV